MFEKTKYASARKAYSRIKIIFNEKLELAHDIILSKIIRFV